MENSIMGPQWWGIFIEWGTKNLLRDVDNTTNTKVKMETFILFPSSTLSLVSVHLFLGKVDRNDVYVVEQGKPLSLRLVCRQQQLQVYVHVLSITIWAVDEMNVNVDLIFKSEYIFLLKKKKKRETKGTESGRESYDERAFIRWMLRRKMLPSLNDITLSYSTRCSC